MPDDRWRDVFAGLRTNRDRALLSLDMTGGLADDQRAPICKRRASGASASATTCPPSR
jgi:hypothetical protein